MISRRLTKTQKDEIVESYRDGENVNTLAEKYSCSSNTIIRTVKTLLSDNEYKLLKVKRSKNGSKKIESANPQSENSKKDDFEQSKLFYSSQIEVKEDEKSMINDNDFHNSDFEEITFLPISDFSSTDVQNNQNSDAVKTNLDPDNKLEEIAPLISSFDFEKKELDYELHSQESLPESVYMLVDKKVELEVKTISDLPEWSFLPENELKRNAILLYSNQRSAKRSCSKNQRVIKIPNTSVFEISKSYLFLKGITRLIIEDSIIALDK